MSLQTGQPGDPPPSELATATMSRRPSLWRQGDFMKLWTGQTISQFGDEITLLALPLLAIDLGAEAFEFGILGVVRFLPWILFTLPAGVWVDRMRRRPILIGADIARAVLLASIPIAFVGGWLTMVQVYIVAFLAGTFEVFFDVAYQSYLPSIVERDELVEGNSKLELSRAVSQVAGPTIAGFLIQAIRAPFAIAFDAVTYLGAALFIGLIRRREAGPVPHDPAEGEPPSMWQEARAGVGYVLSNEYLRSIAACTGTANLFGNISGAVLILYLAGDEGLGLSPAALGVIFALGNLGVLLGALMGGRVAKAIGIGPTIVGSAAVAGIRGLRRSAGPARGSVLGPRDRRRLPRLRGRGLQRQPGRPAPGHHARPYAWAHERDDAPHRVGHDPGRSVDRRNPRHGGRAAARAVGRRDRDEPLLPPGALLARARPARDPGPGRVTLEAPTRCSAVAERLGEPMTGSVDERRRWLLVEDRRRGEKAVRDVLGADFGAEAKSRGLRPLLVRHREGPPGADAVRRSFLVDTLTREIAVRSIRDPSELVLDG